MKLHFSIVVTFDDCIGIRQIGQKNPRTNSANVCPISLSLIKINGTGYIGRNHPEHKRYTCVLFDVHTEI